MLYAQVDEAGREALNQVLKTAKNVKWYRRLKVIDLSAKDQTVAEIANIFDLSDNTVRVYIKCYNQGGLEGLKANYGQGRNKTITLSKDELSEVLGRSPSQFEKLNTGARNWTQTLMKQYLWAYHQIEVSQSAISAKFKQMGITWKRAKKKVTSPDPLYTVKRQKVEQLKQKAKIGVLSSLDASDVDLEQPIKPAKLAYLDSTDLHLCPEVGNTYQSAGEQLKVETPGNHNPWYALFGSLVYPSGEGIYTIHQLKRHQELQAHLQQLIDTETEVFWFVILDNASAHTTPALEQFLRDNRQRLELVFLPTYSPNLNLIEKLWKLMRAQVTNNQPFADLAALSEAVVEWFEKLSFAQFCSVMGVSDTSSTCL